MDRVLLLFVVLILLFMSVAEGQPHHKPKKVRCKDKKFPACYNQGLYCPAGCLRTCVVDCVSCQPVCVPPPPPPPSPPPPPPKPRKVKCQDKAYTKTCNKHMLCPAACPRTCTVDCKTCLPICGALPPTPSYSPPPPPFTAPSSPPPGNSTPPSPPVAAPSPPPDGSEVAGGKRVRCKVKSFRSCYYQEHQCPATCPDQCEVDCVTCSPVCHCDRPGAVCQDPRFVSADGITFYFHGKKGRDFCLVTDTNLHINAHFIGRRNENMGRDFTWVQSLGILYHKHRIFVGAKKTATWDNAIDRLEISFDGLPVGLDEQEGATWQPISSPGILVTRSHDTNAVVIEVEGNFQIKATVVPITKKDSRIHMYGITDEDCFAHLDLGFKFYSLSDDVNGVLGQTYASNYVSRAKMGVDMPVLGGEKEFASSNIFSTDCSVARFQGEQTSSLNNYQYANLNCASGIEGKGVVCKR